MTLESRNSSLLGNGWVNAFPWKGTRNNRRAIFSVVRTARVATQWCGNHISAAANQHATIEKAVFCVGAALRLYNEVLRQLRDRVQFSPCGSGVEYLHRDHASRTRQ
jgi:hypothetical protein